VGYEKDAFLHYHDLGPQVKSLNKFVKKTMIGTQSRWMLSEFNGENDIEKDGKISDVIEVGQTIVVQVTKEPISTKGPRISTEISIAGRYLVLLPFSNRISISQRLKDGDERKRLKRLIQSIKPKGFGVIIRTVAQEKKVADLDADLTQLVEKWRDFYTKLKVAKAPYKVLGEMGRATSILRDILNDSFQNIHVDEKELYDEVKTYLGSIDPTKQDLVKYVDHPAGIFEKFGIERQIKSSFGRTVSMKKGAYLVIEHTEAMHVIDVNSGNRSDKNGSQEDNALKVNLLAAEEIARQLRLRDMGGIIVVDFIDLHSNENRKILFESLKEFMSSDRAKHKILAPSRFGLIEITRQRVRPEINITTAEKCPTCDGSGKIQASILIEDEIKEKLIGLWEDQKKDNITLVTHPFLAAYFTKGFIFSERIKLMFKHKKRFKVKANSAYNFMQYSFFDNHENKLDV